MDICIVGGGASGLSALQVIMETPQYKSGHWRPFLFEARDKAGGVWVPAPPDTADPPLTPLYDSLTTNLPHPIMCFAVLPFPPSTAVYPPAKLVEDYLDSFISHFDLSPNIRLNTTVERLERDETNSFWRVRLSGPGYGNEWLRFDKVVVANGHYRFPRFPDLPGLDQWLAAGKATHSAWYRRPVDSGSSLLVVGGGFSGRDIATEMASQPSTSVVYLSVTEPPLDPPRNGKVQFRARVVEFLTFNGKGKGKVRYEDGIEDEVDSCIIATGYKTTFPFLSDPLVRASLPPTPIPPIPKDKLYNSTYHLFPLLNHLFPATDKYPPTSLAFPGLPFHTIPFPLAEAQSHAIVKLWTSPELFDVDAEIGATISRYERLKDKFEGDESQVAKRYFLFDPQEQFQYRDGLYALAYGDDGETLKKYITPDWHEKMYLNTSLLRAEWEEMERIGEAEDFVKGVGEVSRGEWEKLMHRLLERILERKEVLELNEGT
ncbi:FAD/NAD(P)-binding domain-containing protein [Thelephora ganbajun]|uniref:FAD/NAD(P)-binding domain-containing protein n=1 Tax=Thelephora ganbajun TaxID=370292 RepID=A0ACB6ZV57_THEGA|nr:FAD/NAD(P)-binding domain-containing protein [Thelephora ganbajun]